MSEAVYAPQAREDFDALTEHFSHIRPSLAERFVTAVERTAALLADFPEVGDPLESRHPRHAGVRRMRVRRFKRYVILHRPLLGVGVEILRIVHGARDLDHILDDL